MKNEVDERMANCRAYKTGLPVNIWIDETEAYKAGKHAKIIKFQINKNPKFQSKNTCPMTLDGKILDEDLAEVQKNKEFAISEDERNAVSQFVVNNSYALDKVADQLLWLDEFWEIFIKGGDVATLEDISNLKKKTDVYAKIHKDD